MNSLVSTFPSLMQYTVKFYRKSFIRIVFVQIKIFPELGVSVILALKLFLVDYYNALRKN